MTKTYQSYTLGGKERGFMLRNATIDFIGDLTGADPLEFTPKGATWNDIKEYAATILHAGLLCDLHFKNEQPDFTREDVQTWMKALSPAEIYSLTDMYRQFLNPNILTANGEVGKDTRGEQAADVAGS